MPAESEVSSALLASPPLGLAPITILMNSAHGGGAEYVGRTWAVALRRAGWPVRLLVVQPMDEKAEKHLSPEVSSMIEDLGAGGRLAKYRTLRRLMGSGTSSAFVSMQMRPNLVSLLVAMSVSRRSRTRTAISERNIVSIYADDVTAAHRRRVWLARRLYRKADLMLAISHPVAAEMIAGFSVAPGRCRVIPNPAGAKSLGPTARRSTDDGLELVLAGRLAAQKQPVLAVEVARVLMERGIQVRLRVFGDGPLRSRVEARAAETGVCLEMHGWLESWPAVCGPGSVLILPSVKEGFGNVLVEAALAGIPSVALSGALGVADALVPGVTGVLAGDARPTTLADAVVEAQQCSFEGAERWLRRFSPENSTQALLSALFDLGEDR